MDSAWPTHSLAVGAEGLEPQVYFVSSALLLPQCCFYSTTSERELLKMKGRGLRCVNTRVDPNVHSHLWRHSGLFFCFSWVFYFCKAGFCCLTVFWRWEKYILLPQILSFCLIFHLKRKVVATLKAYGLTFFTCVHVFSCREVGLSPPPREFPVYMEKVQSRSERYLRLPNLPLAFHFSRYAPPTNSPAVLPLSPQQYQLCKELLTIIANMAGNSTHAQNYCNNLLATREIKKLK